MTSSPRRFPSASRYLAATLCLVAFVVVPAGSGSAVTKQQVSNADAKVKALLGEVQAERGQLAALQQQLVATTNALDDALGKLDQTTAHLLTTQRQLAEAQALHDQTIARLNDRAVQAFMGGGGQDFEFLVGASSLSDLSDRLEFMDAVAQNDAELAQTVQNTQNELNLRASQLQDLQNQQQAAVAQAKAAQLVVTQNFQQQQALVSGIASKLAEAERYKKRISKTYQAGASGRLTGELRRRSQPRAAAAGLRTRAGTLSGGRPPRLRGRLRRPALTPAGITCTRAWTSCRPTARRSSRRSTATPTPTTTRSAATWCS